MFYYLNQTTNILDGKIYIGVHKTKNLDDGYMGSGKYLKSAIKKHGVTNFSKVIIKYFEDQEAMYAKEKEIINEDFVRRQDVYNIKIGGLGGWDHIDNSGDNNLAKRVDVRLKIKANHAKLSGEDHPCYGIKLSDERKKQISIATTKQHELGKVNIKPWLMSKLGKKDSEETRQKKRDNHADNRGELHVFFGTKRPEHSEFLKGSRWMFNIDNSVTKVIASDVASYIETGWLFGRPFHNNNVQKPQSQPKK